MSKLKKQAADLAARAAADAEEAAQFRAQAERDYNSVAQELEQERQQVCGWWWWWVIGCVCVVTHTIRQCCAWRASERNLQRVL